MSSGLFSKSNVLIGAGAILTAGIVGGVVLFNSMRTPAPDEKAAVAAAAFAQADEAAKNADGASTKTTEPGSLCPEDMKGIAAKQGGVEACGTGRPPVVKPNPLDGIWEVKSPGNPKVAAMTIFMHSGYGILHRTNPNHPSPAHAVWRMKGANRYGRNSFSLSLSVAQDGTVETRAGQFAFCNCVKIYWKVKPTSDPNIMVGEWRYGKRGAKRGVSTWHRRSGKGVVRSVTINKAYQDSDGAWVSDQFDYGSRPGIIERRHPVGCGGGMRGNCGSIWITVLGQNFAGAHDVWVDPATRLELWKARWVCKNGKSEDKWVRCGIGSTPGETVAGILFKLNLWDGMVPGPINIWVDGQPIPININLSGYPDEEPKPQLVSLAALDAQDNQLSELKEGVPFAVKVVFDADHPDDWVSVDVPIAASSMKKAVLQKTDDPKIFVSQWLSLEAATGRQ